MAIDIMSMVVDWIPSGFPVNLCLETEGKAASPRPFGEFDRSLGI